jgi:hypothetical protein
VTDPEFHAIVRSITDDVPVSFLSPAERKKRRPKVDQLPLCDEPDHAPERSRRAHFSGMRTAGNSRTFRDAVKQRREEREQRERERELEHDRLDHAFWTTLWWTWTWHDQDAADDTECHHHPSPKP